MSTPTVTERASALLARIAEIDPGINAYVFIDRDVVLREAARLDAIPPQERGPLHGVTLAVKDIIDVAGLPTRAGSSFFERHPTEDAPVVRLLRDAGALVIGKTNTHEFAWGVTTENPHFGRTANPWNPARIVGGSSGGAGAAIAADLTELALGTDTLGSIRIPSALCGLTGIRPASGSGLLDGIVPLAPCLDTVGPMAHDVAMVATAYRVLYAMTPAPAKLRVCRLRGEGWDAVDACVRDALDEVVAHARTFAEPIVVSDVAWWNDELVAATIRIQQADVVAANFHASLFAQHRNGYGDDVRERVANALAMPDDAATDARATIAQARETWRAALRDFDIALAPIVASEAPLAPAPASFRQRTIPLVTPASAFGLPSLALPCGRGPSGMPLGMQAIALDGNAATAIAFGEAFQNATDWHERRAIFTSA